MEALGMIETQGFVALVEATDTMLKAAKVKYVGWKRIGSGLCATIITGDVAAVKAATDAGAGAAAKLGEVISVEVIASPHPEMEGVINPGKKTPKTSR